MYTLNDGRLHHEMFQAYRSDLELAMMQWRRAVRARRETPEMPQADSDLARAQQALDRAHPFLPRSFLRLLQERVILGERYTSAPGEDPLSTAELSRIVGDLLAEAEWASRQAEASVQQQRTAP